MKRIVCFLALLVFAASLILAQEQGENRQGVFIGGKITPNLENNRFTVSEIEKGFPMSFTSDGKSYTIDKCKITHIDDFILIEIFGEGVGKKWINNEGDLVVLCTYFNAGIEYKLPVIGVEENSIVYSALGIGRKIIFPDELMFYPTNDWENTNGIRYDIENGTWKTELRETTWKTENFKWRIENDTMFVAGRGDLPGNPPWIRSFSEFSVAVIDDNITSLGHHSFAMAKITSVVIGKNVTNLKTYAFFNCKKLTVMEMRSAVPPRVGAFVFMGTPIKKIKLIVPAGSKTEYQKSKDWKKFRNIEEHLFTLLGN